MWQRRPRPAEILHEVKKWNIPLSKLVPLFPKHVQTVVIRADMQTRHRWWRPTESGPFLSHCLRCLSYKAQRPRPHIVLLLKVHFPPDVEAEKSTVTIQFSTFDDCSTTPELKQHTAADKRLHTPEGSWCQKQFAQHLFDLGVIACEAL